jgi:hypothetical protein
MGALIHRELSGANPKCAVEAARALAQSSDAISGEEGNEARYSLRELAVAVVGETNWPVRLALRDSECICRVRGSGTLLGQSGRDVA